MRFRRQALSACWLLTLACTVPAAAHAQAPAGAPPPQTADDDARLDLAEPDFRLINLPTTLRLPRFRSNFDLTHRFNGNLRLGSFSDQLNNLFGLDQGASVGIEYRIAIARHVQAAVYRTTVDKVIQFYGKVDVVHQRPSAAPVSLSALVSVEGSNNFRTRREPAIGAVVSRRLGTRLALYAVPVWVHNTAAQTGQMRDTGVLGLGARARILRTVYLVGEVSPRLGGYRPGDPEFGFGIEKRVGGHMFQLNFTNTSATTWAQIARGGFPKTLYLGFNLARKFF